MLKTQTNNLNNTNFFIIIKTEVPEVHIRLCEPLNIFLYKLGFKKVENHRCR